MLFRNASAGLLLIAAAPALAAPSFKGDIVPILKTRCAVCHMTGKEAGRMALTPNAAYASIVSVPSIEAKALNRIEPGKPEASYLIAKIEGTHIGKGGIGARMPFGAPPLPQDQIDLFKAWVKAGAKQD